MCANTKTAWARYPAATNGLQRGHVHLCLHMGSGMALLGFGWGTGGRVPTLPKIGSRILDGSPKPLVLQLPVCKSKFCSPWKHHEPQTWDATAGEGLIQLCPAIQQQARNYYGLTSSCWCKQDALSPPCQRWTKTLPEGVLTNHRLFWVLNELKLLEGNWAWFGSHQASGWAWSRVTWCC